MNVNIDELEKSLSDFSLNKGIEFSQDQNPKPNQLPKNN
jgi:hypothetical protein